MSHSFCVQSILLSQGPSCSILVATFCSLFSFKLTPEAGHAKLYTIYGLPEEHYKLYGGSLTECDVNLHPA